MVLIQPSLFERGVVAARVEHTLTRQGMPHLNCVVIADRGNEWVRRAGGSTCHSGHAFLVSPVHEAQRASHGVPYVRRGRHPGGVARCYDQSPIWRPARSAQVLGNALLELFSMVPIVDQPREPYM